MFQENTAVDRLVSTAVILLLLGPLPAADGARSLSAQDPAAAATPPVAASDELVWTASALHRALSERNYAGVLIAAALTRWVEGEGPDVLERAVPLLARLDEEGEGAPLRRCRDVTDPVEGTLCALEEITPLAPGALARELTEEGARLLGLALHPGRAAPGSRPPGFASMPTAGLSPLPSGAAPLALSEPAAVDAFQQFAEQALEGAWGLAVAGVTGGDPPGAALDVLLGAALGFSPGEGAGAMLARVPELRELLIEHPVLGAARPDGPEVLQEYRAFLRGLTGSLVQVLPRPADDGGGAGSDAAHGGPRSQALGWAAHRSFVYLAARSAALGGEDPDVVARVRAVGNAAADLRRGAAAFSAQIASGGQQAAMVALGGNVLSVAAQITSFFGVAPGALGQGAAVEVRALRQAVDTLRHELHGRFDQVEASLDGMLDVLDTRFDRLERLVAEGNRDVQAELASLHLDVLALGGRMERMEENLHSYVQAGFDRDYTRTLILCLEHRERLLPPYDQMEFSTFSSCLADLRARAVQDARDALLVDQATPTDDLALAAALADTAVPNLARRLSLLGRAAEQRFAYPALRGGRGLANPLEWAVAVQAYLTMLHDWPEHARAVGPGDLEAMRLAGVELRDVLGAITMDPATGSPAPLLGRVLSYYETRAGELAEEAEVLARRHEQTQLRRVARESILNRLEPAEAERPSLDVPAAIAAELPQEVRTAAVLALGEASLVYRFVSRDSVVRQDLRRRLLIFGKRHDRLTYTRTRMEVELRFGDLGAVATWAADGPVVLRLTEEMGGDERSENVRSAREHVADPGGALLEREWPVLLRDPEAWRRSPPRPETLASLDAATEAELRRHASAALDNVFSSVCAEDPSTSGVGGADGESAARLRAALDGMTAARVLLRGYVLLGLAHLGRSDPAISASLFGPEAVLDRRGLCGAIAAGESPLRLIWLEDEPGRRSAVLAAALGSALELPETLPQPLALLEGTLPALDAALRLQRMRTLIARAGG